MKKPAFLLLIYLSISVTNATSIERTDVRLSSGGASDYILEVTSNEISPIILPEFPQTSQFTPETDAVPPTLWIVGLGLCLVFLGYKIKIKSTKIQRD